MNLKDFKGTGIALAIILVALATSRGGLSALVPLLRFALPFIALVVVYRLVKGKLIAAAKDMQNRAQGGPGANVNNQQVIDLCPKCGAYMTGRHRCK